MDSTLFAYDMMSVEDRIALTALCLEYVWLLDFCHAEKIPDLFTDDCVWEGPPNYPVGRLVGRDQMVDYWTRRSKMTVLSRHLISNLRFVQDSPTTARGWIGFTDFAVQHGEPTPATPLLVADHIDTYVKRSDGKWKIKTRRVEVTFGGTSDMPISRPKSG